MAAKLADVLVDLSVETLGGKTAVKKDAEKAVCSVVKWDL